MVLETFERVVNDMRLGDFDALMELYDMGSELEEYAEVLSVPIAVIRQNIKDMPTIDAVPVVNGRWIKKQDLYDKGFYISRKFWWECSCCGLKTDWKDESFPTQVGYNYCPNCGARMDGE